MPIDAVIFDIGNVLIEWNPERFYDWQIGRNNREALFAEVDLHAMNDAVDAGAPFRDTVYDAAERHPEWRDEIRMWHDNWLEMASPRIDGSVALLRALRARGVAVMALTNFGIGSFELARTQYEFLDEFDLRFVSGHLGVIKPDPQIYAIVERETGLAPASLLFTDDRADNIAAAAARGWGVHQFTGWQGWARRLVTEGLLNEAEAGL